MQNVNSLHEYKEYTDNYIFHLLPGTPFSSAQYTPGYLLYLTGTEV